MRRGLLSWSEDEVPREVLNARVARVRRAMAEHGLGGLLLYTNFPRPAAVSWLTHFVPYWSQCVLLVRPEGPPVLAAGLSKRVAGWIAETAHVGDVICTPDIGKELARLQRAAGAGESIGVLELDRFPGAILSDFIADMPSARLVDATGLYKSVRSPADETELALSRKAAHIAREAFRLAARSSQPADATILGKMERCARMARCEEILMDVVEDLGTDSDFRRVDGPVRVGERYAIRLSLAYKGHWVRMARSFVRDETGEGGPSDTVFPKPAPGVPVSAPPSGWEMENLLYEACVGTLPLQSIPNPQCGQIVSISQTWRSRDSYWLLAEPALAGNDGTVEFLNA